MGEDERAAGRDRSGAPAWGGLVAAIVREPLVQFLVAGAILAGLYALVPDGAVRSAGAETIVVSEGEVAQLRQLFARTWQRPPSAEELDGIVAAFVREEVLYRAGQALGLDSNDPVIRRRVAQKMEFLLEPAPGELVPTDEDLARHLAAHGERFRRPARLSVDQVTIRPRPGESREAAVADVLAAARGGADPGALGGPTLVPPRFDDETDEALARALGDAFAAAVLAAPVGEWTGPVTSPFGDHIVRVRERVPARDPGLAEIRDAVAADWEATRRRELVDERVETLRRGYVVEVASPVTSSTGDVADARGGVAPAAGTAR